MKQRLKLIQSNLINSFINKLFLIFTFASFYNFDFFSIQYKQNKYELPTFRILELIEAQQQEKSMIKQVSLPKMEVLFTEINCVYQHPLHYTYILHKADQHLYLYDQATSDIIGKSRLPVMEEMKLFAFTKDFNVFYGLKNNILAKQRKMLLFELTSQEVINHMLINKQPQQNVSPYYESYYMSFCSEQSKLICVTKKEIYCVHPTSLNFFSVYPLKYNELIIYPEHVVEITGHLWLVGFRNYVYLVIFSQTFQNSCVLEQISAEGNIIKLQSQNNPLKEYAYVINDKNQVIVIKIEKLQKTMQVCYNFANPMYKPIYLTVLRLGIDTSTANKYRNRLYFFLYTEQLQLKIPENEQNSIMIDQNEKLQNQKKYTFLIIVAEIQYRTEKKISRLLNLHQSINPSQKIEKIDEQKLEQIPEQPSQQNSSQYSLTKFRLSILEQIYLIKDMPILKCSPWTSVLNENKVYFHTNSSEVMFINICEIQQLKLTATQWACMGYKFEVLQKNQIYQQKQSEFQDSSQQDDMQITKQFLDDWSQSILPKEVLLKKNYNRIRTIDLS